MRQRAKKRRYIRRFFIGWRSKSDRKRRCDTRRRAFVTTWHVLVLYNRAFLPRFFILTPSASLSSTQKFAADLRAGVSAAIVGFPQEVNYGLLAVAPLGAAFAGYGIAAALYASALGVIMLLLLGAGMGRIAGPRPTLSILLAGLIAALLQQPGVSAAAIPLFIAATVLLAGLALLIASRVGVGRLIKYVPVAVLSGFTNGVAGLLVLSALPMALGAGMGAGSAKAWLPLIQPAALAVTGITVILAIHPLRWPLLRHIPGILQAMIMAWLLHLLLTWLGLPPGPILGDLKISLPAPDAVLGNFVFPASVAAQLPVMLKFALAIAMTAALETLAMSATLDGRFGERTSTDHVLRRLGLTMMLLSPLGMPVAGSLGRSMSLIAGGARSRGAHYCYAICLLGLTLLGYPLIAMLPQAAIAGILIVAARGLIGQSFTQALAEVKDARDKVERKRSVADLAVMLLVAFITVADSFITGLAVGVICAMALFIRDQSRTVIRRVHSGIHCHSLRLRAPAARAVQEQHGREIAVIEAEGAIFFGSAEHLVQRIESLSDEAREIIIDLRRVTSIDATASQMLQQTARRLSERRGRLMLAHLAPESRLFNALRARGLAVEIPLEFWFADLDSALEHAEESLLARHGLEVGPSAKLGLDRSDLAAGLTAEQLAILETCLMPRQVAPGEALFRQGDAGDSLYIVTKGALSIRLPQPGGRGKRLAAFGPGALIGEMAVLTGAPRSADALADEASELLELHVRDLRKLESQQPTIAAALLRTVAIVLAERVRNTTGQLKELSAQ